jgi:hypothetical protein
VPDEPAEEPEPAATETDDAGDVQLVRALDVLKNWASYQREEAPAEERAAAPSEPSHP